ncbi:MAG: hypothetical protein JOY85_18485 [Acidobacteriaceae bacterium]|nr:hypothetical protein [Acidobacteriaceae bacterium]
MNSGADPNQNLEKLVVDLTESLKAEITSFRDEIIARFDNQAARLDRQAGLIQNGSRWAARMDTRGGKN